MYPVFPHQNQLQGYLNGIEQVYGGDAPLAANRLIQWCDAIDNNYRTSFPQWHSKFFFFFLFLTF